MLEFTAIAIAVLSGVAIISAKVGHRLGAKRAMREIVRVFQREIVSNDDELKSVAEHLHRSRDVTKIAQTLLGAAMREGEMIQATISKPKSMDNPRPKPPSTTPSSGQKTRLAWPAPRRS